MQKGDPASPLLGGGGIHVAAAATATAVFVLAGRGNNGGQCKPQCIRRPPQRVGGHLGVEGRPDPSGLRGGTNRTGRGPGGRDEGPPNATRGDPSRGGISTRVQWCVVGRHSNMCRGLPRACGWLSMPPGVGRGIRRLHRVLAGRLDGLVCKGGDLHADSLAKMLGECIQSRKVDVDYVSHSESNETMAQCRLRRRGTARWRRSTSGAPGGGGTSRLGGCDNQQRRQQRCQQRSDGGKLSWEMPEYLHPIGQLGGQAPKPRPDKEIKEAPCGRAGRHPPPLLVRAVGGTYPTTTPPQPPPVQSMRYQRPTRTPSLPGARTGSCTWSGRCRMRPRGCWGARRVPHGGVGVECREEDSQECEPRGANACDCGMPGS